MATLNPARVALKYRTFTIVATLLVMLLGTRSYFRLGRLEDPDFTIKTAVVVTRYPGASPTEVEEEVTDRLERALQQMSQLDQVRSISRAGLSIIYADIKDVFDGSELPQIWDVLRKKVRDAQGDLPSGASEPTVNDDFGDVYGVFFAITGQGYTYGELQDYADMLRRELLLCKNVASIEFWGRQTEVVYVEMSRVKLASLGLSAQSVFQTLNNRNAVTEAGSVRIASERVEIRTTGTFDSIEEIGDLLVRGSEATDIIRLRDIATIRRGYYEPPINLMRYDGKPAIGLGISTVRGTNVVEMGRAVSERLEELKGMKPAGMEIGHIAYQSRTVTEAVNGFVLNLIEALAIVILLLLVFMGWREGFLIGGILLITILGTFIMMNVWNITLQRISLGALIIALGMLVDNAIVVVEATVIKMRRGTKAEDAAAYAVQTTMWPLLGATLIAILAFAAISLSPDATGEFLGSLFKVLAISLLLSWVFAVTVAPLACVWILPETNEPTDDPYEHGIYRAYSAVLRFCLRHRFLTIVAVIGMMVGAVYGFGFVENSFFPSSAREQYIVDVYMPEGTDIRETDAALARLEKAMRHLDGVTATSTFAGGGPLRFILTYEPEMTNSSYGLILVSVDAREHIPRLLEESREAGLQLCPGAQIKVRRFELGPSKAFKVAARFRGPDKRVLRKLAARAESIMRAEPRAWNVRTDWRQKVKTLRVDVDEARARMAGITRSGINAALALNYLGSVAGVYREADTLLPVIARAPKEERDRVDDLDDVLVWSPISYRPVPLDQVTSGTVLAWEDPIIMRQDRLPTIEAQCDPRTGTDMALVMRLKPAIESIPLPPGYSFEWGGTYESSTEAQEKLLRNVPLAFSVMFLITLLLFNNLRESGIIFLGLPLAIIGVTVGLIVSGQPFGFMALLGFLSLSGMLIKNEVVLIDQINVERREGKNPHAAIEHASVSRVRPVCMAAFTTVLGMAPLLFDVFFAAMAVTIMAGLTFATVLTLLVVPTLYATFFGIREEKKKG